MYVTFLHNKYFITHYRTETVKLPGIKSSLYVNPKYKLDITDFIQIRLAVLA